MFIKKKMLSIILIILMMLSVFEPVVSCNEDVDILKMMLSDVNSEATMNDNVYRYCKYCSKEYNEWRDPGDCVSSLECGHCFWCSTKSKKVSNCERPHCVGCGITSCTVEHIMCHEEGDPECAFPRIVGDINADGKTDIFDMVSLMVYFVEYPSQLDNPCGYNAALVVGGDEPTAADFNELMMNMHQLPNTLTGEPMPEIVIEPDLLKIEINIDDYRVRYYNNIELKPDTRYLLNFDSFGEHCICVNDDDGKTFSAIWDTRSRIDDSYPLPTGFISVREVMPVGTLVMEHPVDITTTSVFGFLGFSISETVWGTDEESGYKSDIRYTIYDALEILKYLVKIDSVFGNFNQGDYDLWRNNTTERQRIREAAFLTAQSKANGDLTIFDFVEVLKYLVGIPIQTDNSEITISPPV